ncbi:MAG: DUF418 domain-containing protein [Deltaproteobacteria bacterium]|nr:DUF418 domain-containing protein [Deltaproteobacteria bacterium]
MQKTFFPHPVDSAIRAAPPNNRIVGYDLARAGALFGMLLVNFSVLMGSGSSRPNWLDWVEGIIRGRAAATFVVLAGAGLSLLTRSVYRRKDRAEINAKRSTLLKRSLFLLVIGLFNFVISPISDILHFYAVYIALGACLLTFSNLSLWLLTAATVVCRPLVFMAFNFVRSWDLHTFTDAGFWNLPGIIGHLFFNGCFPVIPWMAFITVGMWLGRQDFSDRALRKKILLAGIGAVAFAESLSRVGIYLFSSAQPGRGVEKLLPFFTIASWDPMPLFMISAMGTALVVIALIMQLADKYGNARWVSFFASVGQTTLTLYVAHIIMGSLLLWIIEQYELEPPFVNLWATLFFYLVALLFCKNWLKRFRKGPVEMLMRRFLLFNSTTTTTVEAKAPL